MEKKEENLIEKVNKLTLPVTILIASVILGGFYYASEVNKQKSIEKQQQIELQTKESANQAKIAQDQTNLNEKQAEQQTFLEKQQKEVYRKECEKTEEENTKSFEDFLNTCSKYNSVDYCVGSEAGKVYEEAIGSNFIQNCISNKLSKYSNGL